jgi:general secretion pathway protein F
MMTIVATGVVVFLMSYVVPSITQIFLDMNQTLPWPTRVLISISNSIKAYTIIAAFTCCSAFLAIETLYRTKQGRSIIDHSKLKLLLFGKLILKVETARLTRTLGTLLASGIPILRALEITKGVIQNSFVASALDRVRDSVSKGEALANAVRTAEIFPPVVFHIIATGQLNGNLEEGLIHIADMYDDEVEIAAKTLTSLLEPAILLIMGMVVGFIVLAILLPIFEINQLI